MQSIEGKTKFNVNTEWTDISFLTFQPKANEPQDDIIKIDSLQNCVCSFKGKTYIAITQLILHICLRGALWGFQNGKQNKKSNCKNIRDQGSHVQKHWYKTTNVGSRSICLKLVINFGLITYDVYGILTYIILWYYKTQPKYQLFIHFFWKWFISNLSKSWNTSIIIINDFSIFWIPNDFVCVYIIDKS